jgi:hypothetical protein
MIDSDNQKNYSQLRTERNDLTTYFGEEGFWRGILNGFNMGGLGQMLHGTIEPSRR